VRIVAALGGNALLERGEAPDAEIQEHHILRAAEALAPLSRSHDLVITHGNGPQVGLLAVESESDPALTRAYPLDALGAQTQGMIGYWLAQAMSNAVRNRVFAAIVCRTVVDPEDPAFSQPSKFVGQVYPRARAEQLARERNWEVRPDGSAWRRVVPSPLPREVVELSVVEHLLADGTGVICAGGGGIPVVRDDEGNLHGIEAVIDKDRTAALIAGLLRADALLLLTDVSAVEIGYGTPSAHAIRHTSVAELRKHPFPDGSMGPKVEAACNFVESAGRMAAIGLLEDAEALLRGSSGTVIMPSIELAPAR
jgi:carbamate kinase